MVIAGTGHRPQKLGGFGKASAAKIRAFATDTLLGLEVTRLISGLALGWDQALAHAANDLGIPWEAAVPFKGQESAWPVYAQREFNKLLDTAAAVHVVSPGGYSVQKLMYRNEFMVDWVAARATKDTEVALVALWNGLPSGTSQCVNYAVDRGVEVLNYWQEFINYRIPVEASR